MLLSISAEDSGNFKMMKGKVIWSYIFLKQLDTHIKIIKATFIDRKHFQRWNNVEIYNNIESIW